MSNTSLSLHNLVRDNGEIKKLVLERTVNIQAPDQLDDFTIRQFMNHPQSKILLKTITESLQPTLQCIQRPMLLSAAAIMAAPVLSASTASVNQWCQFLQQLHPCYHHCLKTFPWWNEDSIILCHPWAVHFLPLWFPNTRSPTRQLRSWHEVCKSWSIPRWYASYLTLSINPNIPAKDARAHDWFVGSDLAFMDRIDLISFQPRWRFSMWCFSAMWYTLNFRQGSILQVWTIPWLLRKSFQ